MTYIAQLLVLIKHYMSDFFNHLYNIRPAPENVRLFYGVGRAWRQPEAIPDTSRSIALTLLPTGAVAPVGNRVGAFYGPCGLSLLVLAISISFPWAAPLHFQLF